jgi:hypothetical protein
VPASSAVPGGVDLSSVGGNPDVVGTETDLHTPHWHGNTVLVNRMRMDTVNLLPASMVVVDMVPDIVGIWLFHCHVNDHIRAGMLTRYRVLPWGHRREIDGKWLLQPGTYRLAHSGFSAMGTSWRGSVPSTGG